MREPAVAGMFYPGTDRTLRKELKECFMRGPGRDSPLKGPRITGIISPHAGYTYSGATAARGFMAMADGGMPETVVVVGPNHHGIGSPVAVSGEDFKLPMGTMTNDIELGKALDLPFDDRSHRREHSMEVQLPFVQYLSKDTKQVCISMLDQSLRAARDIGEHIARAVKDTGRNTAIVGSSDFTHCGWNYGFPVPGGMNAGEFARSLDMPVIERLLEMDLQGAFSRKRELGTTACGLGPIAAMMEASMKIGARSASLLGYTTSYDVMPADSAVGYASVIVL